MSESNTENWNDKPETERLETIESVTGGHPIESDGNPVANPRWPDYRPMFHAIVRREWKMEKEQHKKLREATEKYEQNKSPEAGFFKCPNCGHDAGEFTGDDPRRPSADDFEGDGEEFITGTWAAMGGHERRVECPSCDTRGSRQKFKSEWEDEHGTIPSRNVEVPAALPSETASGQAKMREQAARSKNRRR